MANIEENWYTEEHIHAETSWNKMQDEFVNIGYREGITHGKENSLQEGFDEGFEERGAPLGRRLGVLRGIVNAMLGILQVMTPNQELLGVLVSEQMKESLKNELQELSRRLNGIGLKDIAPRDPEAEAHAREHRDLEVEGTDDALADAIQGMGMKERPDGSQELTAIQNRLQDILKGLGISSQIDA